MIHSQQHSNIAEEEMAQLHSLHICENAINKIRRALPQGNGTTNCQDCGVPIPPQRKRAIPGCLTCVQCQTLREQ